VAATVPHIRCRRRESDAHHLHQRRARRARHAPATPAWALRRDFSAIGDWRPHLPPAQIENGPADGVGATQVFPGLGGHRKTLLALDDLARSSTWRFDDSGGLPVRDYLSTIQVTPRVDGRSQVTRSARFDCDAADEPAVRAQVLDEVFRPSLAAVADEFKSSDGGGRVMRENRCDDLRALVVNCTLKRSPSCRTPAG
jgi:Polyketide cyclase / dehydrase and lipid transport